MAAVAAVAAIILVAAVAIVGLGAFQSRAPQGQVLAATGHPQLSPPASQLAIAVGEAGPSNEPGHATEPSSAALTTTPAATSKAIATPRPTIRPTLAPTPAPTRQPSPKPTAQPTPTLPPAPLVSFSYDVSGATVAFTNSSTGADPTWFWNFHDGSTSLAMSPLHEFLASGTYVVELTMTDAYGRTDSDSQVVTLP
jgi:PKD repeat protein